jgi:hypothetical protein
MRVYKIRNRKTGLFSTGGMRPKWTKQGKSWSRINYVHSHIQQLHTDYTPADVYNDAEIVMAEITELLTPVEPANDWLHKTYDDEIEENKKLIGKYDWAQNYVNRAIARKTALK